MNILIASDSFKGSLNTFEAASRIQEGVLRVYPDAQFEQIPVADGGEGTVDAILSSRQGSVHFIEADGPLGRPVRAKFGILSGGDEAIIEMAAASGLPLILPEQCNIFQASTYGTGQLILAALDHGCKRIYIGIGGSATNDGGAGMLQALGVSLLDGQGNELEHGCAALGRLRKIDLSGLDRRIRETALIAMCDVDNPLCGPQGASAVYGPQKGARPEDIPELNHCLANFADIAQKTLAKDLRNLPGAGAAGGLGWGLMAFLNAKRVPGIHAILDITCFEEKLRHTNMVITGEGSIDNQSIRGKVIDGIARRAREAGVPVIAIAGGLSKDSISVYASGVSAMEACVCRPMQLTEAMTDAHALLADAAERVMRTVKLGSELPR